MESPTSGRMREQEEERQRLQKENFNMKLRIFYLEERMQKLAGREGGGGAAVLADMTESAETRAALEQCQQDLEDRNVLLVKARYAIEALQADLGRSEQVGRVRPMSLSRLHHQPAPLRHSLTALILCSLTPLLLCGRHHATPRAAAPRFATPPLRTSPGCG